ncbi:MAG: type III-B CRISPR module-associated protein Cmr3 [Chloroflexota bacterium]
MMQLFLEAVDVWLFRDGRPFDAFSDHRAESLFPPYPGVMQGVIRSHHLVVKGVDLRDKQAIMDTVGTATDYKGLCLRGPFIARQQQDGQIVRYYPLPADATPQGSEQFQALRPRPKPPGVLSNVPTPMLLLSEDKPQKAEFKQWLDEESLFQYLKGQPVKPIPSSELFGWETRLGIGRDDERRITREGALYEVDFIRPRQNVGLFVEVAGYEGWPASGLLRIGGEGRGARFTKVNASTWPSLPVPLPTYFKVYFATPTYFTSGWQPQSWGSFFEGNVTLQAAALNRYESIGGFDWAKNDHKAARRYVPAGSVYYFRCEGEARLKPGLIQNALTDFGAEIGFGQIIIPEEEWNHV